ncbi:siderophore-interacting protein [Actinomycetes bacterium KLBMP 9759]
MRDRHLEVLAEVRAGATAAKVGYPIRVREVEVVRTLRVTPGMIRVTLGGDGCKGFESHVPGEHVKIIMPDPETGELRLPVQDGVLLAWPRPLPTTRDYTVRRYDADAAELDIDVVVHDGGLVSTWARKARAGDRVHVAGPPGGLVVPDVFDRYLIAGDHTALPAIEGRLSALPPSACGWVVVQVSRPDDEVALRAPSGIDVRWTRTPAEFQAAVTSVAVPEGERVYVWLAGEAGVLKPLRRWVRDELRLDRCDYDITGYWKRGVADFDDDGEPE